MKRARLRRWWAITISFIVVCSTVALAARADGRTGTEAKSNDGGAWMVSRRLGIAAHIERGSREPTVSTNVGDPGADLLVTQSIDIVAVHDRSEDRVVLVSEANAAVLSETTVPDGAEVRARQGGVVVFDPNQSALWSLELGEFSALETTEGLPPLLTGATDSRAVIGQDGAVALVKGDIVVVPGDPEQLELSLGEGFSAGLTTMLSGRLVVLGEAERSWRIINGGDVRRLDPDDVPRMRILQQPGPNWPVVAGIDDDGEVRLVNLESGDSVAWPTGDLVDGQPITDPIFHDDCFHVLSSGDGPVTYGGLCADGVNTLHADLDLGPDARLRLVNGFVWIEDPRGSQWVIADDLNPERIEDYSTFLEEQEPLETEDGTEQEQEAGVDEADKVDENPDQSEVTEPLPPIAEDDTVGARSGRPVVVDVLANDSDPNADVVLIESAELLSGKATIEVSANRTTVQVDAAPGEQEIRFRYSISDGNPNHVADAAALVTISPLSSEGNRPPEPATDLAAGAVGARVSANLLDNDDDPDGDTIRLVSINEGTDGEASEPTIRVLARDPGGEVILALPEDQLEGGAGTLTIPYVIEDEWGERAEGSLRLELRGSESNLPPDARNDSAVAQVGQRIAIDLLANDSDPDNDPLSVVEIARPERIGAEVDGYIATSDDGEFVFEPSSPGTFVFKYAITDRQESDSARIRVEVVEKTENNPPIAVRDDLTMSRGETRLLRALENDGDPDGDVIGIVGVLANNPNLEVVEEQGYGFWVTLGPDAAPVEDFVYRISDGIDDSGLGQVFITRSDVDFENAPPIVLDDSVRVRPGRTSQIDVLANDYDPEGSQLTIVANSLVATTDDVTVRLADGGAAVEVIVPDPDAIDAFAFTYAVEDDAGNLAAGEVEASLVPVDEENAAPIARADQAITIAGEPVIVPVLANDYDPESDAIELVSVPNAPTGEVELSEDGNGYRYTPAPGFTGTDTFSYLIRDSEGGDASGAVRIGVMARPDQNRPPVARADEFTFKADGSTASLQVLLNDFDPDGDDLTILGANGDAEVASTPNRIDFPLPDQVNEETELGFRYEIGDLRGGTDEANVLIRVLPSVDGLPPVANPDVAGPIQPGRTIAVDVLRNDEDPDGEPAELAIESADAGATIGPAGPDSAGRQVLNIVAPAETGQVAYTIVDPDGFTSTSFVTVNVADNLPPEFASPIRIGDADGFPNDEPLPVINLADYVTDPDGDELTFGGVSGQIGGTTFYDEGGRDNRLVEFVPGSGFLGEGGFAFTVDDGNGHLVSGRVVFTVVGPANEPPIGIDQTITLEAGVPQPFSVAALFTDPDPGDTLSYAVTSGPGGAVAAEGTGDNITLSAPIDAAAETTAFTVEATDSAGETASAVVTVNLQETSVGPPEPQPDSAETNQEQAVTVNVLANDIDNLGQSGLSITGTFSQQGPSSHAGSDVTFTPAEGFFGTATVDYTVTDGRSGDGGQATGVLTVNVIGRPSAPATLTANPLPPRAIAVSWQAAAANGAAISDYEVEVTLNGAVAETRSAGTTPSITLTELRPGENYQFRVRAVNSAGAGDWSGSTGNVVVDQAPSPPGRPTAQTGDGQMVITWPEAANEGSAIEHYKLEISQCASENRNVGLALSYTWTGLTNGSPCAYRVTATNGAGGSDPSPLSDLECPSGAPEAPPAPSPVRGDKEATVTWTAPTNPDCQPLIGFEVVRNPDSGVFAAPAGTSSWQATGLVNGTTYNFQVRAQNRAGWGEFSPRSEDVIPCGVPLAPPTPTARPGDRQATITFGDADANGCAISQYRLRLNSGDWVPFSSGDTLRNLENGRSYTVQVQAINAVGVSDNSAASAPFVPIGPPTITSLDLTGATWRWTIDWNGDVGINQIITGSYDPNDTFHPTINDIDCVNAEGNRCGATYVNATEPGDACLQSPQRLVLWLTVVNDAGPSEEAFDSKQVEGCPPPPSLRLEQVPNAPFTECFSVTGPKQKAIWSSPPAGTSSQWIIDDGGTPERVTGTEKCIGLPFPGTSNTFAVYNCNQFGCSGREWEV